MKKQEKKKKRKYGWVPLIKNKKHQQEVLEGRLKRKKFYKEEFKKIKNSGQVKARDVAKMVADKWLHSKDNIWNKTKDSQ